jgi:hypothetical protein
MTITRLALLLLLISAGAQEPQPATVEGIVTRMGTNAPVPDIYVMLRPPNGGVRTATTGADGRFRITDVSPGQSVLSATGRGLIKSGRQSGPSSLLLGPGEQRKDVRLRVQATAVITGRVLDANRRPRSGIGIQLLRYGYENGVRVLVPSGVTPSQFSTDDRGEYRIFDLEPDEYIVAVLPSRRDGGLQLPPVYYPGVTDLRLAVPVIAGPGAEAAGIDFALAGAASYPVRFKVSGFTSGTLMIRPIPRGGPVLHDAFPAAAGGGCARENTDVTCNLVPGQYDIFARTLLGAASEPAKYGRLFVSVVDRAVDAPVLTLNPAFTVQGRIVIPEALQRKVVLPDLNVVLSRVLPAQSWFSSQSDDSGGVQPDGTFRLEVFEGHYRAGISELPDEIYIESATYAARDVLGPGLTIERDSSGVLELVLAAPAGSLEGDVRLAAGEPSANGIVILVPSGARRDDPMAYRGAVADANGAFSIRGIPPGEYSVLAWEDVDSQALRNRAFVERFEQRALKVTISRGDMKRVTLTAIHD